MLYMYIWKDTQQRIDVHYYWHQYIYKSRKYYMKYVEYIYRRPGRLSSTRKHRMEDNYCREDVEGFGWWLGLYIYILEKYIYGKVFRKHWIWIYVILMMYWAGLMMIWGEKIGYGWCLDEGDMEEKYSE